MATIPPYDPRFARQQAKAQRAAQRQAVKLSYRAVARPSMIGPISIVTIGVVALLMELSILPAMTFWSWAARWWPLLIILIGLVRLGEYFLDRKYTYAKRRGWAGAVFFVVLLALFSTGVIRANSWYWQSPGWGNWSGLWNTLGVQYSNQVDLSQSLQVASGVTPVINIQNPNGDVMVTASTDGAIHLVGRELASTGSQASAKSMFAEGKPQIALTTTGANVFVPATSGLKDDLTLQIPATSSAVVYAGHGNLTVEGLGASSQLKAPSGDVKVEDMGAAVQVQMTNGDFSAHQIKGPLSLTGGGGDVAISGVTGPTTISGEYYGDIYLNQMQGAVEFHSSRTQIEIPNLTGSMTLDSGGLGIDGATGPVSIVARAKDMNLTGIGSSLKIEDSDGNIQVALAQPLGHVQITNHAGDVSLTVPKGARFTFKGSTSEDEDVNTTLPFARSQQNGQQFLQGSVGSGGPLVEVSTTHGELNLQTQENHSAKSRTPAPHFKSEGAVKSQIE